MNVRKKITVILFSVIAALMLCLGIAFGIPYIANAEETETPVVEETEEAQIGESKFATLSEALEKAQTGETVKLIKNATLETGTTITKSITLDLNKNVLTINSKHILINDATLTVSITNGTIKNEGVGANAPGIYVNAATKVNITDVILDCKSQYGILISKTCEGTTTIKNCEVAAQIYGVNNRSAGATTIVNCKATSTNANGYAIYTSSKGAVTMSDVVLTSTGAKGYGFYATASCTGALTISGTNTIFANFGITDFGSGNTEITGTYTFSNCQTGIYLWKVPTSTLEAKTTIYHATISGASYGIANSGTGAVSVYKSDITALNDGINGNGTKHGTDITVTDTMITAKLGIYHPQNGKLLVRGGTINASETGIEMRGGELILKDGTVIDVPLETEYKKAANGNGATVIGAGVAISQHTTNKPISVTIENARISAPMSLVQVDLEAIEKEPRADVAIRVNDGDYIGGVESERVFHFIYGGEFNEPPAELYLADNLASYREDNGKYLVSTDVGPAMREASDYVRLYASTKQIEYTAEINAIIHNEKIETLDDVYNAKLAAIAEIDKTYKEIADAKEAAISAIHAEATARIDEATGEEYTAVVVPTATLAAINAAKGSAQIEAFKQNAIYEIREIRAFRKEISELGSGGTEVLEAIKAFRETLLGDGTEKAGALFGVQTALEEKIKAVQEKAEMLATSADLNAAKAELTTAITNATADLKQAISEGKEAADKNANALKNLGVDVTEIKAAIAAIKPADLSSLAEKLEAVQTEIEAAVEEAEQKLHAKLEAITLNVGAMNNKLNETNSGLVSELHALDERISKLGTVSSNSLEAELNELAMSLNALDEKVSAEIERERHSCVQLLLIIAIVIASIALAVMVVLLLIRRAKRNQ